MIPDLEMAAPVTGVARRAKLHGIIFAVVTAGMLLYLGGGVGPAIAWLLLVLGILLPAASLLTNLKIVKDVPPELRIPCAIVWVLLCATPWYYARRFIPLPPAVIDVALALLLTGWALISGSYRALWRGLATPIFQSTAAYIFVCIPILFCLCWAGFGVKSATEVRYYGLFPVDFGNLASVVSSIKASPGLPLLGVDGAGPMIYHWYYFALPAWLSDAFGFAMPNSAALILCNYITACLLFVSLAGAIRRYLPASTAPAFTAAAAALAVFASFVARFTDALLSAIHLHGDAGDLRNLLLLPPVNSMAVFGNNTLALAMILLVLGLIEQWNRVPRFYIWAMASLLMVAVLGYSATLFFPLALTVGCWVLLGRVKRPVVASIISVVIGLIGYAILSHTQILGQGARNLAAAFDYGRFIKNTILALTPLIFLALVSLTRVRKFSLEWLFIGFCILIPSFLYISGTSTGGMDFSMKTGSLLAVLLALPASVGLLALVQSGRSWKALKVPAAALVVLGMINTLGYAGQFAYYRLSHKYDRALAMPADYDEALNFIRLNTPRDSILIDTLSLGHTESSNNLVAATMLVAQRRTYLPTQYDIEMLGVATKSPELLQRLADYKIWHDNKYSNPIVSTQFAKAGDYILLPLDSPLDAQNWLKVQTFGNVVIYKSRRRGN